MSQHLVFANCIPLVLKFFNQNIMAYIGSKNNIALLDFPSCVIGEQPELTAETLEIGDTSPYCWRNMFSCINLLRVLNKLTKWKHSRIMVSEILTFCPNGNGGKILLIGGCSQSFFRSGHSGKLVWALF
jgi:hypothetical protein